MLKSYFLFICILFSCSTVAQPASEELTLLVTPAGDSLMMSAEKTRPIKIGDTVKYITVNKSRPVLLNGKEIFKIQKDTTINDSTRFAMYMGTPVRTNGKVDSNVITAHINYYRQIRDIEDSCFDLFDKHLINGVYSLEIASIVINERGKIVYYETSGVKGHAEQSVMHLQSMKGYHNIPEPLQELFNKRLHTLLTTADLNIFIKDGKPTPFYYGDYSTSFSKGKSDEDTPEYAKPKPPENWNN